MIGKFFFADISNFTKTTEMFIKKSQYGQEVIRDIVDSVFSGAIQKIYEKDGYVILFAGDGLLFYLSPEFSNSVRSEFEKNIDKFNRKMSTELGIKIEEMTENLFPHIVKAEKREFIYFHPQISSFTYEDIKESINLDFPPVIGEMRKKNSLGELREIPAGFINIAEEKKPEDLREFFEQMISEADREQVYVNKIEWADKGWMVLVACGMPVSVENAPMRLLYYMNYLLKKAEQLGIEIKIGCTLKKGYAGIIGGEERWEYTFIGGNINLAARIAVKGESMKIFSDKSFADAVSSSALFDKYGDFTFKGINEPVEVMCFKEFSDSSKKDLFVGRQKETAEAISALSKDSTCLLVSGEGGIGKTHFVNSVLKSIPFSTIKTICSQRKEPFFLAMKILLEMDKARDSIDSYESVFLRLSKMQTVKERFKHLLNSFTKSVLIIIDDSQYIDSESLELLNWVFFERPEHIRFIFIGREMKNLSFIKSKLSKFAYTEINLIGFNEEGISDFLFKSTMLKPKPEDVRELSRISGGNPLYLNQIISFMLKENNIESKGGYLNFKSRIQDFPYSLKELILVKFDRFPAVTKNFVETGSVIGEEFVNSIALNSTGSEDSIENAVTPAVENKILSRKYETVSMFYHSIVKQTIFDRMLKKRIDEICVKVGDEMARSSDNPFMLLQAGDFYASAGHSRAFDMFISAARLFKNDRNSIYASHSLNKALSQSVPPQKQLEAVILYPEISRQHVDKEFLENAFSALIRVKEKLSKDDASVYESIAYGFLNILRENKKTEHVLRLYKEKCGETFGYCMLKGRLEKEKKSIAGALKVYKDIKKRFKMNFNEEFEYYLAVASFYFFNTTDRKNLAVNLKKLELASRKLKDSAKKAAYFDFMTSVFLHTNEIKKAEAFADKNLLFAKKSGQTDLLTSLYNTFAIINSNKFFKTKNRKYEKLSLKYHKKIYDIYKKDMNLSALPLITTNLGMAYLMAGDAKKNFHYLYEGLLYGLEIDHPVEVPYNYILLSLYMYERGAEKAAFNLSDFIINYKHKIDICSTSFFMKYLQTRERKFLKRGLNISERYLKRQNTPPYQIYYDLMFMKHYRDKNTDEMKRLMKQISEFEKKANLRQNTKNKFRQMKLISKLESGSADAVEAEKSVNEAMKMKLYSATAIMLFFSYGKFLISKNKIDEGLKSIAEGRRLSKKLLFFNHTLAIDEYLSAEIKMNAASIKRTEESRNTLKIISSFENLEQFKAFIEE
ncbi:MAG: AAA family ATPase [bacterium]